MLFRSGVDAMIKEFGREPEALARKYEERFRLGLPVSAEAARGMNREELRKALVAQLTSVHGLMDALLMPEALRKIEKRVLLSVIDAAWQEELEALEEIKRFIHLRGYAQLDPLVEYKKEGFDQFERMLSFVRDETLKTIFGFQPWGPQAEAGPIEL